MFVGVRRYGLSTLCSLVVNKGARGWLPTTKSVWNCVYVCSNCAVRMVMSEQGGLAMHQLPMHHRGLVQPSLVMNPHPLNDSCSMDSQNSKFLTFIVIVNGRQCGRFEPRTVPWGTPQQNKSSVQKGALPFCPLKSCDGWFYYYCWVPKIS